MIVRNGEEVLLSDLWMAGKLERIETVKIFLG